MASRGAERMTISSCLLLLVLCLVDACGAWRTLQAAAAPTVVNVVASQLLSKPDCCWQCVKVAGCVDDTDQGRAVNMFKENEWAAASRKDACLANKCVDIVYQTFPATSANKVEVIPPFVSIVLANTASRVVISGRTSVYQPQAQLRFTAASINVQQYVVTFQSTNWFLIEASKFTLQGSTLRGNLRLLSIQASAVAFRASTVALTNSHVAIKRASTVLLERTAATFSCSGPRAYPQVGPYTLGTSFPFTAADATLTLRGSTLTFQNTADAFFLRSTIVLTGGARLVLINSNARMISCTLSVSSSTIELRSNSRLLLSRTRVQGDRFLAQVQGGLSIPKPKAPFRDVSGLTIFASGTGRLVLRPARK